jgi:hypothetical protein
VKRALPALALGVALTAVAVCEDRPGPGGGEAALAAVASASAGDRIVLASGPLLGVVEPCRCTEGMLGGLPRRAALIERLRGAEGAALLEVGDLAKPSETQDALIELRVRAALEALALTSGGKRPHAVALGCTDLRLGLERLERIKNEKAPDVTLVATNLRPTRGTSFLAPSLIAGDVLVLAVLDPVEVPSVPDGYQLSSPREAIVAATKDAAGKRVVVLFHGDPRAAKAALDDVPGLAAILCGHGDMTFSEARTKAGVPLLALDAHGQILHALALGPAGLAARATHPLDGNVPDRPAVRAVLDRFYEAATKIAPEVAKQKVADGGRFLGSKACADCHASEWKQWQASGHSHALERLREKDPKRAGLAECTACHVTGVGFEGGWSEKDAGAASLGAVGCEECHGPGSTHVDRAWEDPDKGGLGYGSPPGKWPARWQRKCILCHDPRNSPAFDLEKYLERIRHWKIDRQPK